MSEEAIYRTLITNTPIDEIVIIWSNETKFLIEEIILSNPEKRASQIAIEKYPESLKNRKKPTELKIILNEINNYFNKKKFHFSLKYLNMDKLTQFQKKVLIAEFNTKKGTINSYGLLAKSINKPKAYRAVGNALAKNPFPIIIPCHRTVKGDRTLGGFGGFQGNLKYKQILLEIEGVNLRKDV